MKTIALIHTVKSVANTFDETLRNVLGEQVKIHNLWDDFLANHPNEVGCFTIENKNRLFGHMKAAELTGADLIVTTCSTLTPTVEQIRPFVHVPIIAIDDAMAQQGVTYGDRIMVMATAQSTVAPTIAKLTHEAQKIGTTPQIDHLVSAEAFAALKRMDLQTHDRLLTNLAMTVNGYDCIILAQASMAHLREPIGQICDCPVLSSPDLCIAQIARALKQM